MSDIRALLTGRTIVLNDGTYHERADVAISSFEGWLRAWRVRFSLGSKRRTQCLIAQAARLEASHANMDDAQLRQALTQAVRPMQRLGFAEPLLAEAFSVVREASRRVLGMRHHDVQLLAAWALLQGRIAEMATGEGKTLAATLAVCTAAASGATVHVVTVNDYLAERDCEHNRKLYDFFRLSVGLVKEGMPIPDRKTQYAADIVYVSNKELTFDYLKDRIALRGKLAAHRAIEQLGSQGPLDNSILRGLQVAIVDEADSILIDEARTPLIISESLPDELGGAVYSQAIEMAMQLKEHEDFRLGLDQSIFLAPAGQEKMRVLSAELGGIWDSALWRKELSQKALSAIHSFRRDEHYIVLDNKVQIVDEFTGRVMADRTWERGLHQMIEAKENCDITGQRRTLSQITYQRFFGRYLLLAGMTGTAKEVEPELKRVYDLSVTLIPTHKPSKRKRMADSVFRNSEDRWIHVAERAMQIAGEGRAVLVGTRSVEASERLSRLLEQRGVAHTVLNARQDKEEAERVTQAGQTGRITVATNMAGRGTDIKLSEEVEARGGLHVILTEFHESARVDRQLFGRAARQGNPGSAEAIVCLQDELFRRNIPGTVAVMSGLLVSNNWLGRRLLRLSVRLAQFLSEHRNRTIRLDTIKRDRKWIQALGFAGSSHS